MGGDDIDVTSASEIIRKLFAKGTSVKPGDIAKAFGSSSFKGSQSPPKPGDIGGIGGFGATARLVKPLRAVLERALPRMGPMVADKTIGLLAGVGMVATRNSMSSGPNFLNLILPSCGLRRSEMSRSHMIFNRSAIALR